MANPNFTCVLDAWRDGTVLYGRMHYYRSGSYFYQDRNFPNPTMNLGGSVYEDVDFGNRVRAGIYVGDVYSTTFSRGVSGTGTRTVTWTASGAERSDFAGTWSKDVGGFPGTTSPPTNLSFTGCTAGPDWYDIGVSVSGWGNGGSAAQRYIEAQVWTRSDSGLVEPRRFQASYGTMSATIRVNNSSSGSLTITPNTIYTVGIYATNGAASAGSARVGNHCSAPPVMTSTASNITETSAVLNWSFGNQGGAYSLILEYSLDGTTWNTMSTQTGSGAKSGTYTVSGLTAGTAYSIRTRIRTTNTSQANYITDGNTVSVTTYKAPNTPTVSASAYSNTQINVTYGTTSFNNPSTGTVYLYGGTGATPTTEIASKTTTGNSTYNHTSLAPNTKYYFRSRAYNGQFWSSYSSIVNATTLPSALASKSASPLSSESAKVSYSISSDGGALTKYIEYSLDNSTWQNGASITGGSSTSGYFIVSGLSADTTHTIYLRVRNSSGSTSSGNVQVTTYPAPPAAHPAFIVPTNQFGEFSLKGNTTQQTYTGKNLLGTQNTSTIYQTTILTNTVNELVLKPTAGGNSFIECTIPASASTQYTASMDITTTGVPSGSTYAGTVYWYSINSGGTSSYIDGVTKNGHKTKTFTTKADTVSLKFRFFACELVDSGWENIQSTYSNIQLEQGSPATTFEPYVGGIPAPNPDYPQAVNTVTGRQVVTISDGDQQSQSYEVNLGKNLLDESTMESGSFNYIAGNLFADANFIRSQKIPCTPNTTYTFSSNSVLGEFAVVFYGSNQSTVIPGEGYLTNNKAVSYTSPANAYYMRVKTGGSANPRPIGGDYDLMIELGSTATTYAPYFTPIELCKIGDYQDKIYYNYGKNRIGFPSASASSSKHTLTVTGDGIITVNGGDGTGSSVTNMVTSTLFNLTSGNKRLTLIPISGDFTAGGIGISFRDSSDTQIAYQQIYYSGSGANVTYDYTDAQVAQITKMYLYVSNAGVFNNFKFRLQLTDGTTDDPNYQPYVNATPGWYVHKETARVDVSSLSGWFASGSYAYKTRNGMSDILPASSDTSTAVGLCNAFSASTTNLVYWGSVDYGFALPGAGGVGILIRNKNVASLADFTTYLSNNQVYGYFAIATPTDVQITDATLIAQLEALSKAPTFGDDTNIDVTSENLPLELAAIYRSSRKAVKMYAGVKAIGDFRMNGDTTQQAYSGKNLLDSSAFVGAYINSSGNIVNDSGNNNALFDYIPVSANSSYTASYNGSGTVQIQYAFFNSSKTIISRDVNFSEITSRTVTTPASCAYIRVWFYRSPAWTQTIVNESKLQLESGSTATTFEPYVGGVPAPNPSYPQVVNTVTGRQVVTISDGDGQSQSYEVNLGKNLFDKDNINILNGYFESSGDTIHAQDYNRVFYIPCEPNTAYSFTQGPTSISTHLFQIATTAETPAVGVTVSGFFDAGTFNVQNYITASNAK